MNVFLPAMLFDWSKFNNFDETFQQAKLSYNGAIFT